MTWSGSERHSDCVARGEHEGKLAALQPQLDGQLATVRIHETTIRLVSTQRDEARAETAVARASMYGEESYKVLREQHERACEKLAEARAVIVKREREHQEGLWRLEETFNAYRATAEEKSEVDAKVLHAVVSILQHALERIRRDWNPSRQRTDACDPFTVADVALRTTAEKST